MATEQVELSGVDVSDERAAPHDVPNEAFPKLDEEEVEAIRAVATVETFADGESVFHAGRADVDLFIVKSGYIDIRNPTDNDRLITSHAPGEFAGDIDLLTRRPVIVNAVARADVPGGRVEVLRVPADCVRDALNTVPRLGEKMITAFTARREQLQRGGVLGLKVVGPGSCRDTTVVREFLYKNFVPFTWFDTEEEGGRAQWEAMGRPKKTPSVECTDGTMLYNPPLLELAKCAGVWRDCPGEEVDLAVIGAGPAGLAAAVYAASEGLKTVVLDRLGPGGQVGGSSLVENFIGFPAGLSGAELAMRGCLQMLKFGAKMVAPVSVDALTPRQDGSGLDLALSCGNALAAQVVLVATGVHWRKLDVPGARRFERAGVYYACTSVEGFLHRGQEVAVIGAGNSAGQAVMFLAERAAKKVHLLVRKDEFGPGMSDYLAARIRAQHNVEVHTGVEVSAVHGNGHVEAADLKHTDGRTSTIGVNAIFVFIGAEPHATWLPESVARDKLGYLLTGADAVKSGWWPLTDREPCPLETTLPRVLAGGDIRAGSTKRVGFAVGDGSLAVTCVHRIRAGH
ncbi:MAG TPA: FAD-dependent oxidoreductase [Tepidisphaeraceae bacterium]|nr:FAD-dependent oxidoreductase [Tepidisphaeraceae bacterium]